MDTSQPSERSPRLHDLDWLRVLVVGFVVLYHAGMVFHPNGWLISNEATSREMGMFFSVTSFFRMPVLFFVAGAGTWFAFRRLSAFGYIGERSKRLLIPLWFGMIFLIPIERYFQARWASSGNDSYLATWRRYLDAQFPAFNADWGHLWFIGYLFVLSVVATPLFIWLRTPRGQELTDRALSEIVQGWRLFSLSIPLIIIEISMRWKWPSEMGFTDDWTDVLRYFVLLIYGYVLFSSSRFWPTVERLRFNATVLAFVLLIPYGALHIWYEGSDAPFLSAPYFASGLLAGLIAWTGIVALVGYARKFLMRENAVLRYSRDASYPVYVLHGPIVVATSFIVVAWDINLYIKFVVISGATLMFSVVVYDLLVRRWFLTRIAFGLKVRATDPIWIRKRRPATEVGPGPVRED